MDLEWMDRWVDIWMNGCGLIGSTMEGKMGDEWTDRVCVCVYVCVTGIRTPSPVNESLHHSLPSACQSSLYPHLDAMQPSRPRSTIHFDWVVHRR